MGDVGKSTRAIVIYVEEINKWRFHSKKSEKKDMDRRRWRFY